MTAKENALQKFRHNPCLREVLQLYSDGFNCREIARIMNKSYKTVENQCELIRQLLETPNMCRAVVIGIRFGIIEIRDVEEEEENH
jgi:DNA-binding CsgD family transcriptional regulator